MIESRLDEATDGTGGGYGKYPGLSVAQIAERFRFLIEEGEGRSAKAILRMVYEQTESRGNLGAQRILAVMAAGALVILLVCRTFVSDDAKRTLTLYIGAAGVATVLFVIGAASVQRAASRGEAQVREIRRLALMSLDAITSSNKFRAKSLEREHVAALTTLKKSDPVVWRRVNDALRAG